MIALGRRHLLTTCLQHRFDIDACLGADARNVLGGRAEQVLDLSAALVWHRGRQVDLIDHRHDGQVLLQRGKKMRHRLRLDSLRGVHHQDRPFTRLQRTVHFIAKIHMAGVSIKLISYSSPSRS